MLATLLVGCGGAQPFSPRGQCDVALLGTVLFEDVVECNHIREVAMDAHDSIVSAGLVDASRWDSILAHGTVWIRADANAFTCGGPEAMGCQWNDPITRASNIELQGDAGSLLHELLHRWDVVGLGHSDADTVAHKDWEARGWVAADVAFEGRWVVHGAQSPPTAH